MDDGLHSFSNPPELLLFIMSFLLGSEQQRALDYIPSKYIIYIIYNIINYITSKYHAGMFNTNGVGNNQKCLLS